MEEKTRLVVLLLTSEPIKRGHCVEASRVRKMPTCFQIQEAFKHSNKQTK